MLFVNTIGINTVAVIKNSEESFKIFYAYSGICMGCPTHLGNVPCLPLKELKTLYHICKFSFLLSNPFEIEVFVGDNELDLENRGSSNKIE